MPMLEERMFRKDIIESMKTQRLAEIQNLQMEINRLGRRICVLEGELRRVKAILRDFANSIRRNVEGLLSRINTLGRVPRWGAEISAYLRFVKMTEGIASAMEYVEYDM